MTRSRWFAGSRHLRFRGTDVIVFQLLDPHELTFPVPRPVEVSRSRERGRALAAEPSAIRKAYLRELAGLTLRLDRELRGAGIDYRAARHLAAAGLRAVRLSRRAAAAEVGHVPCRSSIPRSCSARWPSRLPIVLHLLRRDVAPEVPFTAVRLLRRSPIERTRRRRLRDLLLLAARVAALTAARSAFARPVFHAGRAASTSPHRRHRSFVQHGSAGTFARALAQAREAVGQAGDWRTVAVIAFDDRADVVAQPGPAGDARAALDGLNAGFGATRFAPGCRQSARSGRRRPGASRRRLRPAAERVGERADR